MKPLNWEVMFWKLASLVVMGWYDEARRMIETAIRAPLVSYEKD